MIVKQSFSSVFSLVETKQEENELVKNQTVTEDIKNNLGIEVTCKPMPPDGAVQEGISAHCLLLVHKHNNTWSPGCGTKATTFSPEYWYLCTCGTN